MTKEKEGQEEIRGGRRPNHSGLADITWILAFTLSETKYFENMNNMT